MNLAMRVVQVELQSAVGAEYLGFASTHTEAQISLFAKSFCIPFPFEDICLKLSI